MNLIYLGDSINSNLEYELIPSNLELGFDCIVIDNNNNATIYHNCTEVHHRYDNLFGSWTAFESDIHSTGITVELPKISSIIIVNSAQKHEAF